MTTILLASLITMSILRGGGSGTVDVTLTIPAAVIADAEVVFYPVDAPETCLYPRRQLVGDYWVYSAKIATLQDRQWIALVTWPGKAGIRQFVPTNDSQLTLNIYALPAPAFAPAEGGYAVATGIPPEVLPYVDRAVVQADGKLYGDTDIFAGIPAFARTKIYFGKGYDKWALSEYYSSQE